MRVRLITPVYNDWPSFRQLLCELDAQSATLPFELFVSAIDDGSTESVETSLSGLPRFSNLAGAEIIRLATNVGHQRAIALGLCTAAEDKDADAVLIMDADGEDPPASIVELSAGSSDNTDFCLVALRRKRVETVRFKLFYLLYKFVFKLFTGKSIGFGNYCMISRGYVQRLVMVPDLWNNLPAAILRSRFPIRSVPLHRGSRYAGKSKMNFTSLITHGLSGISVYADTIFVRLLLLSAAFFVLGVLAIAVVFTLRFFFPSHATPGWATTVSFGMILLISQAVFTTLSASLTLLNSRVQGVFVPFVDFRPYILRREMLFGSRFSSAPASSGAMLEMATVDRSQFVELH